MNYYLTMYMQCYLYGILPCAVVSAFYCAMIAHTMPIFKDVKINSYIRFKFGMSAFVFVCLAGIVWPISLPIALLSIALQR